MPIKYKFKNNKIFDFPVVQNYKYLGIEIDYKGTISLHIKNIASKINYVAFKLNSISIKMDFSQRLFLYRTYIEPYFIYMSVASSFNNKTLSTKLVKYRKKLPPSTPDTCINLFLKAYQSTILDCLLNTLKKIQERGMDLQDKSYIELHNHVKQPEIKFIPKNLQLLFAQIIKLDVPINIYQNPIFSSPKMM